MPPGGVHQGSGNRSVAGWQPVAKPEKKQPERSFHWKHPSIRFLSSLLLQSGSQDFLKPIPAVNDWRTSVHRRATERQTTIRTRTHSSEQFRLACIFYGLSMDLSLFVWPLPKSKVIRCKSVTNFTSSLIVWSFKAINTNNMQVLVFWKKKVFNRAKASCFSHSLLWVN